MIDKQDKPTNRGETINTPLSDLFSIMGDKLINKSVHFIATYIIALKNMRLFNYRRQNADGWDVLGQVLEVIYRWSVLNALDMDSEKTSCISANARKYHWAHYQMQIWD